jgi:hypothetical protein
MNGDVQSLHSLRRLRLIADLMPNWYETDQVDHSGATVEERDGKSRDCLCWYG